MENTNTPEIIGEEKKQYRMDRTHHFSSGVYTSMRPEFLSITRDVSKEYLRQTKKEVTMDKIYPAVMSNNFAGDIRIREFAELIAEASYTILADQGYDMSVTKVIVDEVWAQEHYQYSGQEEHVHNGHQISGFYFMDVPKEHSQAIFYDPRPAKRYANLKELNIANVTDASIAVNYTPEPGLLLFANSWLPHSFTKNPSKTPFRFIHFNVRTEFITKAPEDSPEII